MARKKDVYLMLILWAFTAVFFLLQVANNFAAAITVIIFTIMAGISLIVLLFLKSDDAYYENLQPTHILYIIIAIVVMYIVSLVSANYFPAAEKFATIPGQTSILTSVVSDILFTFTMVAIAEEMLKLGGYTEIKERFSGHWYKWLVALLPVFLWAGYHAIQAYTNVWYLIPAFVDGLVLLALLETTKSFLAPILAHGAYNSILIVTSYYVQSPNLPFFPALTSSDFLLIVLCVVWVAFVIGPVIMRARSGSKRKRY